MTPPRRATTCPSLAQEESQPWILLRDLDFFQVDMLGTKESFYVLPVAPATGEDSATIVNSLCLQPRSEGEVWKGGDHGRQICRTEEPVLREFSPVTATSSRKPSQWRSRTPPPAPCSQGSLEWDLVSSRRRCKALR